MSADRIAELRKLMSAARAKAKRRRHSANRHYAAASGAERDASYYAAEIERLGGKVRR